MPDPCSWCDQYFGGVQTIDDDELVFLDERFAYFLGLVLARGELVEDGTLRTVKIEFGASGLRAIGLSPQTHYDQMDSIHAFFSRQLVQYIGELSEGLVRVSTSGNTIYLSISSLRDSAFWANLKRLVQYETTFRKFEIHPTIFKVRKELQRQLVRGFADAAGYVRAGNKHLSGYHRIFIQVANQNWKIPIQLCHLLQDHLQVPVEMIDWGHPNLRAMRDPTRHSWAKEHQIRIYADEFERIGLQIEYRQKVLEELVAANKALGVRQRTPCCPWLKRLSRQPAVPHPDERSSNLDPAVRHHYDAYWQICRAAGCVRQP